MPTVQLKVPYNWNPDLLAAYARINREAETRYPVGEVYAGDRQTVVGTGRAPAALPERVGQYRLHIDAAHAHQLRFSFVLNACSMAGREWDHDTQQRVYSLTRELVAAGVDGLIVTMPYLAALIHRWFPAIRISSSVNNQLDSVEKIAQLLSATPFCAIQFPFTRARDFVLYRDAAARFPAHERIALVNESCLPDCAFQRFHQDYYNFLGVDDRRIDFYHLCCATQKLEDPLYVLKSQWVMPEDLHHLADSGITTVKLAGRDHPDQQWLIDLAGCYARGRTQGNVFRFIEKSGLLDPRWSEILGEPLQPCHYQVDHVKLAGFIDRFVQGELPCVRNKHCAADCTWCARYLPAVTLPPNREERLAQLRRLFAILDRDTQPDLWLRGRG